MDAPGTDSAYTQRLLEQICAGQPKAQEQLFARHRSFLRRFVALRADPRLRARLDPSDVVQETQMEALRRLDDYLAEPTLCFRLWLRQLAYDRLLHARRQHLKAKRRSVEREVHLPEDSSVQLGRQLLSAAPGPTTDLLNKEFALRVREAVHCLPEADREMVLLRNFEGLSNQEAAQLLGLKPATASQRYGRALIRLREILLERGLNESET
jgi:RNA polymerase sigma-70 factor (ECF subfamily)